MLNFRRTASSLCCTLPPKPLTLSLSKGCPFFLNCRKMRKDNPSTSSGRAVCGWLWLCRLTLCVVRKSLSFFRCYGDIDLMIDDDTIPAAENIPKRLWLVAILAFFGLVTVAVEGWLSSPNAETMGQWGDFFGGTLNPILTFLTVAGLLYTIILQRSELRMSREELILTRQELKSSAEALRDQNDSMKQQRFESTLFSMIGVLNQIIDQMDVTEGERSSAEAREFRGRDCFSLLEKRLKSIYKRRPWVNEPQWEPPLTPVIPAKAGIHEHRIFRKWRKSVCSVMQISCPWILAFAGMTN
jgi:hypothetical protein